MLADWVCPWGFFSSICTIAPGCVFQIAAGVTAAVEVEDHTAPELKSIIARCRMFVGARTHATIAAYSSGVPTLVVGYSVKARGIARDLFGTEAHYVLPVQDLKTGDDLSDAFRWLLENEDAVRTRLEAVMPEYVKNAYAGLEELKRLR